MKFFAYLTGVLLSIVAASSGAEILHGVEPLNTLGDIKKKFPNALVTRVRAAWVTENEDFYSLKGEGFPGVLYIAFQDERPTYRRRVADLKSLQVELSERQASELQFAEKIGNNSDDVALNVEWVRWVPSSPIPLERYKSKYGEPSKCDFKADTMAPYCTWQSRSLTVNLSDDKKLVLHAEAAFTVAEQRIAWKARFNFVPDYLAELPDVPSKQSKKKP